MKKKLSLNKITVHSFALVLDEDEAKRIKGGWTEGTSQITAGEATCHWICITEGICTYKYQCCQAKIFNL